jgi:hypothetical protein
MPVIKGSEFISERHDAITGAPSLVAMFGFNAISTGSTSDEIVFRRNYKQDVAWLRLSGGIGTPYKGYGSLTVKGFEPATDKVYISNYDISDGLYSVYYDADRDSIKDTVVGRTSKSFGSGSVNDHIIIFSGVSPSALGLKYDFISKKPKVPSLGSAFVSDLQYKPDLIMAANTSGIAWI